MTNLLLNLLPVLLLLLCAWRTKPVAPFSSALNPDYLSVDNCMPLRGFFALVVIFHHLGYRTTSGTFFHFFSRDGALPVAVFFFLSGYGLQKQCIKRSDYAKNFLLKRIPPVLFPYIIITFIYWVVYRFTGDRYSLMDFVLSILKGQPLALFSWYIISILLFYIVFWFLMRICRNNQLLMILGAAVWCLANLAFCTMMSFPSWWYNASHLLVIGMFWAVYEAKILTFLKMHYWFCAIFIWTAFILLFCSPMALSSVPMSPWVTTSITAFSALFLTLSVILFTLKFQIGNPIMNYLGEISLELYITQGIFMLCLHHPNFIHIDNDLIYVTFCLAGTILFSGLFHLINQRLLSWHKRKLPVR